MRGKVMPSKTDCGRIRSPASVHLKSVAGISPPTAQPRPDRHSAHEQRQHQRLRVGRVAEKEFQVVAPDRLVDESGKPGYGEQQKKYASGDAAHVWIVGRGLGGAGIIRAGYRGLDRAGKAWKILL